MENDIDKMTAKTDFAARISQVLNEKGFATRGRAQRIKREGGFEVSDRAINKWLSGDAVPDHANKVKLAKYLDVSFEWLASGRGAINLAAPGRAITEGINYRSPSIVSIIERLKRADDANAIPREIVDLIHSTLDTYDGLRKKYATEDDEDDPGPGRVAPEHIRPAPPILETA